MWIATLILLTISNVFMTFAWYGHLKFTRTALWAAVLVSWLIAFVEYCFQVPANRLGHNAGISTAQLKTVQEVITLTVFCVFSLYYLKEPLRWNYLLGFCFIAFGALLVFAPWQRTENANSQDLFQSRTIESTMHPNKAPAADESIAPTGVPTTMMINPPSTAFPQLPAPGGGGGGLNMQNPLWKT